MLEIIIQGRGGQGAQSAGQILATAFFKEGNYIQSFASYGGARRGAPVSAFLRVDKEPIRLRCDIERADAILFFDASLLSDKWSNSIGDDTIVLINSVKESQHFNILKKDNVYSLDAKKIASIQGLGRIVNTTLVGAFAALLEKPDINNLLCAVREMSPIKVEENVSSCMAGYQQAKKIQTFKGDKNTI